MKCLERQGKAIQLAPQNWMPRVGFKPTTLTFSVRVYSVHVYMFSPLEKPSNTVTPFLNVQKSSKPSVSTSEVEKLNGSKVSENSSTNSKSPMVRDEDNETKEVESSSVPKKAKTVAKLGKSKAATISTKYDTMAGKTSKKDLIKTAIAAKKGTARVVYMYTYMYIHVYTHMYVHQLFWAGWYLLCTMYTVHVHTVHAKNVNKATIYYNYLKHYPTTLPYLPYPATLLPIGHNNIIFLFCTVKRKVVHGGRNIASENTAADVECDTKTSTVAKVSNESKQPYMCFRPWDSQGNTQHKHNATHHSRQLKSELLANPQHSALILGKCSKLQCISSTCMFTYM